MRLIDEDALLKQIAEDSRGKEGWYGDTWEFINTIKDAPTIDAVQVVRCFECKAFILKAEKPRYTCYNPNGLTDPKPNDYCSHGERSDDAID